MTDMLVEQFQAHRGHLQAVARRMLGSTSDAEDAVQEAWLRLSRTDAAAVANLGGWLTTAVSRICLDVLRARALRREEVFGAEAEAVESGDDTEQDVGLADAVGVAMSVVLDRLTPPERVAFVLHDVFSLSFEDIAQVLARTPAAARQLASRGRRRLQEAWSANQPERNRKRELVEAFLAASRGGDLSGLLRLLAPDAVLRADLAAVALTRSLALQGAAALKAEIRGRERIADLFAGRAHAARTTSIDGESGLVIRIGARLLGVVEFTIAGETITELVVTFDRARLEAMRLGD